MSETGEGIPPAQEQPKQPEQEGEGGRMFFSPTDLIKLRELSKGGHQKLAGEEMANSVVKGVAEGMKDMLRNYEQTLGLTPANEDIEQRANDALSKLAEDAKAGRELPWQKQEQIILSRHVIDKGGRLTFDQQAFEFIRKIYNWPVGDKK